MRGQLINRSRKDDIEETKSSQENNDNPILKQIILDCAKYCVFERIHDDDDFEAIVQVDGSMDILDEEPIPECLRSVNCEPHILVTWINFFRGFDCFWEEEEHCICEFSTPTTSKEAWQ